MERTGADSPLPHPSSIVLADDFMKSTYLPPSRFRLATTYRRASLEYMAAFNIQADGAKIVQDTRSAGRYRAASSGIHGSRGEMAHYYMRCSSRSAVQKKNTFDSPTLQRYYGGRCKTLFMMYVVIIRK